MPKIRQIQATHHYKHKRLLGLFAKNLIATSTEKVMKPKARLNSDYFNLGVRCNVCADNVRPPQARNRCLIKATDIEATMARRSVASRSIYLFNTFLLADQNQSRNVFNQNDVVA